MTQHGELYLCDQLPPHSIYYENGRFGRIFPSLQPFAKDTPQVRDNLIELGKAAGLMDPQDPMPSTGGGPLDSNPDNPDHPTMPPGFTFLG